MPEHVLGLFPNLDSTFRTNDLIGGCGGKPFIIDTLDKGSSLTELKVWLRDDAPCAIDFTSGRGADTEVKSFGGHKTATASKLCLGESEKITELIITYDADHFNPDEKKKSFLRGISIETNKGQKFEIMPEKLKHKTKTLSYSVGSGVCCGVFGYADENFIHSIGFIMLKPVKEAVLKNITYDDKDESTKTFPQLISSCEYDNDSELEQSHKMKATKTLQLSHTWGTSHSIARTLGFKVEAGYPRAFKIGGDLTQNKTSTHKHDHTSSETESRDFEWSVNCSPKSTIEANAILFLYEIEAKYKGTMELRMESGKVFSYKVDGIFKGIHRAHCVLKCKETKKPQK